MRVSVGGGVIEVGEGWVMQKRKVGMKGLWREFGRGGGGEKERREEREKDER